MKTHLFLCAANSVLNMLPLIFPSDLLLHTLLELKPLIRSQGLFYDPITTISYTSSTMCPSAGEEGQCVKSRERENTKGATCSATAMMMVPLFTYYI